MDAMTVIDLCLPGTVFSKSSAQVSMLEMLLELGDQTDVEIRCSNCGRELVIKLVAPEMPSKWMFYANASRRMSSIRFSSR